jgi:hypothetical protein
LDIINRYDFASSTIVEILAGHHTGTSGRSSLITSDHASKVALLWPAATSPTAERKHYRWRSKRMMTLHPSAVLGFVFSLSEE